MHREARIYPSAAEDVTCRFVLYRRFLCRQSMSGFEVQSRHRADLALGPSLTYFGLAVVQP